MTLELRLELELELELHSGCAMDAFPPSYVDHNLPLVLISGLAASGEAGEGARDSIASGVDGADGGVCVFSDFPLVVGAAADGLLAALLAEDASLWPWSSRYFSHRANGIGLRIQRASRVCSFSLLH